MMTGEEGRTNPREGGLASGPVGGVFAPQPRSPLARASHTARHRASCTEGDTNAIHLPTYAGAAREWEARGAEQYNHTAPPSPSLWENYVECVVSR